MCVRQSRGSIIECAFDIEALCIRGIVHSMLSRAKEQKEPNTDDDLGMPTTTLALGDVVQKVLPCKGAEYTDTLIKQLSDGGAASPSAFQGLTDEQFFDRFSTQLDFTNEEIADLQEVRNYVDGAGTVGPECKHNGDACDPHENSCSPMRSARSDSSGSADLCLISFVKSMFSSRSTDYTEK